VAPPFKFALFDINSTDLSKKKKKFIHPTKQNKKEEAPIKNLIRAGIP
jgi:hypothetical protein